MYLIVQIVSMVNRKQLLNIATIHPNPNNQAIPILSGFIRESLIRYQNQYGTNIKAAIAIRTINNLFIIVLIFALVVVCCTIG